MAIDNLQLIYKSRVYIFSGSLGSAADETKHKPFTPQYQFAYSPYCSLYISLGVGKENLFNSQELLSSVISSFILITLIFDSGLMLWRAIRG